METADCRSDVAYTERAGQQSTSCLATEFGMAYQSPIRTKPSSESSGIPDKLYFRIGEVARLCDVPAYVLRFWESEFSQLRPNKGGTGQRLYRRRDVETALRIKYLLYDEGYTIPGARQLLQSEGKQRAPQLPLVADVTPEAQTRRLQQLRRELRDLLAVVSQPAPASSQVESLPRQRTPSTVKRRTESLFDFGGALEPERKQQKPEKDGRPDE